MTTIDRRCDPQSNGGGGTSLSSSPPCNPAGTLPLSTSQCDCRRLATSPRIWIPAYVVKSRSPPSPTTIPLRVLCDNDNQQRRRGGRGWRGRGGHPTRPPKQEGGVGILLALAATTANDDTDAPSAVLSLNPPANRRAQSHPPCPEPLGIDPRPPQLLLDLADPRPRPPLGEL